MSVVTVTRRGDALEGERVQVLRRWRRKHGGVDLLVVLSNGRKRLIPQAWTDADTSRQMDADAAGVDAEDPAAAVGMVADVLAAVVIVSALSRRLRGEQAASQSTGEEDNDAACAAQSAPRPDPTATTGAAGPVARARRGRSAAAAGTPDRKSGRRGRGGR